MENWLLLPIRILYLFILAIFCFWPIGLSIWMVYSWKRRKVKIAWKQMRRILALIIVQIGWIMLWVYLVLNGIDIYSPII